MIAIAAGHQCSPRSAADASSITGRRAWFRPVAILHDEPGLPGAEILHSGRIPSAMAPQDGAVRRIRRTPTRSRPSVMARPDHLVAMFGDGLAGDHRRGAGGSRSRSEDSHGQDQTRRAGGAVGRTRLSEPRACDDRAKPFTWTKAAGQLATKITREKASGAQHQGRHRQNSLPSGSARTYQFWSPRPTSTCRAPMASRRSSPACWSRLRV